ncbi:hypothetical protein CQ010_02035 [Arthrobacter sp. MYb211]|uniref:FHA domain-containing protein n=1 Tax=unclassified Arthrobacter TaxID=235627 RepID=UPI000CFE2D1E|nr:MULTISPECIES: FHA domain-containing protein [unclassified Arthrobacter]PRA13447.1 hypothetical protein CQ015_04290 [Arthrobacter sp. MYb221]PRC10645.1 hypothetical protein CQ010_02035 [Arthrobacter sp. MYb211]
MSSLHYVPGDQYALVGREHVILLPADTSHEQVLALWGQMNGSSSVESLLGEFLALAEMKISSMPPFAIVSRAASPHVVVRGEMSFTVGSPRGEQQASGTDVATWQERRFAAAETWTVSGSQPTGAAGQLPLNEGIVRAAQVSFGQLHAAETTESQSVGEPADRASHEAQPSAAAKEKAAPANSQAASETEAAPEAAQKPDEALPDSKADVLSEPVAQVEAEATPEAASAALRPSAIEEKAQAEPNAGNKPAQVAPLDLETTQDPENFAEVDHASEVSLAGDLLGRRGESSTQYTQWDLDIDDGDTIIKSSPAARAKPAPATAAPSAGDHDGQTIMRADLPERAKAPETAVVPEVPDAEDGTQHNEFTLARVCLKGHANPPTASTCSACAAMLTGEARQVRRPALGKMFVTDTAGARESAHELTRSVIVGRQPSSHGSQDAKQPKLIRVDSPSGDISRSHLQVRLEGWHVELVDLGATNGTVLLREGQAPRRLGKSESVLLLSGDVADLGDGVSLRFEDLP